MQEDKERKGKEKREELAKMLVMLPELSPETLYQRGG